MIHLYCKENGEWVAQTANAVYRKVNGQWEKVEWSELGMSKYLFETLEGKIRYVSLGDSIAAGHTINDEWDAKYGERSQYYYKIAENTYRTEPTVIVPDSYTDLIRDELVATYGANRVLATSFARSGDTVADLMEKLSHEKVRKAIEIANIVTICIGANDVLQPALSRLEEYIYAGDTALNEIAATVEANLAVLADDSDANSYTALFNKLKDINPNAKYVFTTIYNPYKYLWLDEGTDGFFEPLLSSIPQMTIVGIEVDELIKQDLLSTSAVKTLFGRVNGLNAWAEKYVTKLNTVLRSKITAYANANFLLADTKAVFDPVPDRTEKTAPKHYNDLVNVEYTTGFRLDEADWGRLWESSSVSDFWWGLATEYASWSGFDISGFANDLVQQMVEKVIVPDIDPHPEWYGHHALKCSFADALGWSALPRRIITFNANGGSGTMASQVVVALDNMTAYANINTNAFGHVTAGYYWTGWKDTSGNAYTDGQFVGLSGDLALNAQWSNLYTVTFRHSEDTKYGGSADTGPMECYALWIDGAEQADLGAFSNPARTYRLPYGTPLGVIAAVAKGSDRSHVTFNGTKVAGNSGDARYGFDLTGDVDIHFEWNYWLDGLSPQSYWNCYITTK